MSRHHGRPTNGTLAAAMLAAGFLALLLGLARVPEVPAKSFGAAGPPPAWLFPQAPPESLAASLADTSIECVRCHLADGRGRPECAALAGLPGDYIRQQVADFRDSLRGSGSPGWGPTASMRRVARSAAPEQVDAAAARFSALTFKPATRVVEAATVPISRVDGWIYVKSGDPGTEPLGHRILEVAADSTPGEVDAGSIAYVPRGSLERGAALVTAGGDGTTLACRACHGPALGGAGKVPGLVGRSPSYVVRQLYAIQSGARAGAAVDPMKPVTAKLTLDDMIAIAAYLASRPR